MSDMQAKFRTKEISFTLETLEAQRERKFCVRNNRSQLRQERYVYSPSVNKHHKLRQERNVICYFTFRSKRSLLMLIHERAIDISLLTELNLCVSLTSNSRLNKLSSPLRPHPFQRARIVRSFEIGFDGLV
jgi:hypothetical protein